MRINKAYFTRFKREFKRLQKELGLMQYSVAFFHEKLDKEYAKIRIDEMSKTADVFLTNELHGRSLQADSGPEIHARHEIAHLLVNRLRWLGEARYIENLDLEEEWEAIAVRLERVLK